MFYSRLLPIGRWETAGMELLTLTAARTSPYQFKAASSRVDLDSLS